MSTTVQIVYALLLGFFVTLNLGYIVLMILGISQTRWRTHQHRYTHFEHLATSPATIPVSVIVTAYNEETVIADSIASMLRSDHPEFEVIVVNDGSTDRTLEVLTEHFELEVNNVFYPAPIKTERVRAVYRSARYPNLSVVDKENGRQADAANAGVNLARYRYIAQTDSDCTFEPDTLLRVMRVVNFDPGRVIAIGGQLRLSNGLEPQDGQIVNARPPRRWVERFQVIEYLAAFLTHRLGWGVINGLPVVAGGWGIWRKDVVVGLDGYSTDTTHNDIEITLHAHEHFLRERIPYEIVTVPDSIVWTQAPTTWKDLQSQRTRWQRVVLEVIWKYRRMLFNPRYGMVGMITMPYLLIYEGLGPFIEAFAYLFAAALAIAGVLDLRALLVFTAFSIGLSAALRLAALFTDVTLFATYDRRGIVTLVFAALLEPLIYHPMLLPARMFAFYEFLKGKKSHASPTRGALPSEPPVPLVPASASERH